MKLKFNYVITLMALVTVILLAHYFLTHGFSSLLLPSATASTQNRLGKLPDFSKNKEIFFTTLYPIIKLENEHILRIRKSINQLQRLSLDELSAGQKKWLFEIAKFYQIDNESIDESMFFSLLERVDYLPPSLILTQAAIESNWGTSRFSKQGNNLFGLGCYVRGCGMEVLFTEHGKVHEIAQFDSVNDAVRAYIKTLNTHDAYTALRKKRADLRDNKELLTGIALAQTFNQESEQGHDSVANIIRFIRQNDLPRFTSEFEHYDIVVDN